MSANSNSDFESIDRLSPVKSIKLKLIHVHAKGPSVTLHFVVAFLTLIQEDQIFASFVVIIVKDDADQIWRKLPKVIPVYHAIDEYQRGNLR
ncbi:hypothetical protein OGATHE_006399 [Ogataea polymorpha]|uniref:Uncharacterized protein n=1 Tax=Ogataea polymorpha TaxID=460523 RepID=A0A9P8NS08_9ASCO|nr:hypothetical protein OGATHE_006399 [Ogataea polymorpha]